MPKSPARRSSRRKPKPRPLTGHQRKTFKTWLAADGIIRQTARRLDRDRNLVKVELRAALEKLGYPADFAKALKQLRRKHK